MSRERRRRRHERRVLARLAEAQARGDLRPGHVYVIDVRHEDGCALLAGKGPCDCEPDVYPPERVPAVDEN